MQSTRSTGISVLVVLLVAAGLTIHAIAGEISDWEQLTEAGIAAYEARRLTEAEGRFRAALMIADRARPHDWRLVLTLENLGDTVRTFGRTRDAEELYRRAVTAAEELEGPDHARLLEPLKVLAWFYQSEYRYRDAAAVYERARGIASKNYGPNNVRVAAYTNALVDVAWLQGRYREAEALSRDALAIMERNVGADNPEIGAIHNDLARILSAEGRRVEAEAARQVARRIFKVNPSGFEQLFRPGMIARERALGPQHPSVTKGLYDLALIMESQGKLADAAALVARAVRILERSPGSDELPLAVSLETYGEILRRMEQEAEARIHEARAAAIRARHVGNPFSTPSHHIGNHSP